MVIQNSEVSMTSKSSIARGTNLSIQSETKPLINLTGIQMLGELRAPADDLGSETEVENQSGFMSSLNYAMSADGKVQEVGETNPLLNMAANRQARLHTMEYLLRMFLLGRMFNNDYSFGESWGQSLGHSLGDVQPTFVQTTTLSYTYWEKQSVEYSSTGTAITADGRKLSFDYSFAMTDEFAEKFNVEHIALKNCIDPLVINLDDCPTSISNQTFFFDLDGDGEIDELHNLGKGSGFLALDKNEDGEINDGLELFGAKTGDGFRELAEYDEDGNGWIDEKDSIFAKLRIMTINEKGEKELYGLKESDVGAIYLGSIGTQFMHKDDDNNTNAVLRESGIFLHESDGHAGGVQHVDFTT